MADEIKASPRNEYLAWLADKMTSGADSLQDYRIHEAVPLLGGTTLDNLTGLRGASRTVDNASYGNYPMRVPEMTQVPQVQQGRQHDLADTLMFGDIAGGVAKAGIGGLKAGARKGADALLGGEFNASRRDVAAGAAGVAGLAAIPAVVRKAAMPIEREGAEGAAALAGRVGARAAVHADYPSYASLFERTTRRQGVDSPPLRFEEEHMAQGQLRDIVGTPELRSLDFSRSKGSPVRADYDATSRKHWMDAWQKHSPEDHASYIKEDTKVWKLYDQGKLDAAEAMKREDELLTIHINRSVPGNQADWARMSDLNVKTQKGELLTPVEFTELRGLTTAYHKAATKAGIANKPLTERELQNILRKTQEASSKRRVIPWVDNYSKGGRTRLI